MVGAETVAGFKVSEKASCERVEDLLKRRAAIKRAVVLSNAVTKVTVNGVEYTVAEAIEMKNHGLDGKKAYLNRLSSMLRRAESTVEATNSDAERRADMHVKDVAGSKDLKAEEITAIREGYLKGVAVEMVDGVPGGAKVLMQKLRDEIDSFEVEVDSVLSTSNALTEIEVKY